MYSEHITLFHIRIYISCNRLLLNDIVEIKIINSIPPKNHNFLSIVNILILWYITYPMWISHLWHALNRTNFIHQQTQLTTEIIFLSRKIMYAFYYFHSCSVYPSSKHLQTITDGDKETIIKAENLNKDFPRRFFYVSWGILGFFFFVSFSLKFSQQITLSW